MQVYEGGGGTEEAGCTSDFVSNFVRKFAPVLYCQFMATRRWGPQLYFYISRSNP